MSSTRAHVLSLYKKMITEGNKFCDYNYREYALRKTRDSFKANKGINNVELKGQLVKMGEDNLHLIQRQDEENHKFFGNIEVILGMYPYRLMVLLGQMYGEGKLVIESLSSTDNIKS